MGLERLGGCRAVWRCYANIIMKILTTIILLSASLLSCNALDQAFSEANMEQLREIGKSLENIAEKQRASDDEMRGQFDRPNIQPGCTYKTNRGDTISIARRSGSGCIQTIEYDGLPATLQP